MFLEKRILANPKKCVVMTMEILRDLGHKGAAGFQCETLPFDYWEGSVIALSFSRMNDMECPFLFNAKHIEKTHHEVANEAMLVGGEVASFLKSYREFCYENAKEIDQTYFWGLFDKWLNTRKWTDADKARQCCKNFLASEFALVPLKTDSDWCMIEQKLVFDKHLNAIRGERAWFDSNAAFRVVGDFIYRQGNTITIVDEKTGWAKPDPKQLEISQALISRAVPALSIGGVWHVEAAFNILSGFKPEAIRIASKSLIESAKGLAFIQEALQEVNSWPEKYKDGYPAVACSRCEYCTIPTCPIRKDVMTSIEKIPDAPVFQIPDALETVDQAQKAVTFVTFIEQLDKQLKALLKAYVDKNGAIVSGGMQAAYTEAESFEIEKLGEFLDLLVAFGASKEQILDALNMTKTSFDKLIKKAGLANRMPMLMQMVTTKTSRRFGIKKAEKQQTKMDDAA